jgi:hypothetical protein
VAPERCRACSQARVSLIDRVSEKSNLIIVPLTSDICRSNCFVLKRVDRCRWHHNLTELVEDRVWLKSTIQSLRDLHRVTDISAWDNVESAINLNVPKLAGHSERYRTWLNIPKLDRYSEVDNVLDVPELMEHSKMMGF